MPRRWVVLVAIAALVALACKTPAGDGTPSPAPSPVKGFPSSMVALGDSVTAAFGSCFAPVACPRNSWSTGDGVVVLSHYRRIVRANPAMSGHAGNLAVPGARVGDLGGQASRAAAHPVDYVTVLIGANDACSGAMTSTADFRVRLGTALATLRRAMPNARVLIVGIPNVYRVWEVAHTSELATHIWQTGHVCPNLLNNATSTAAPDVARRAAFRDQINQYNGQLKAACSAYGSRCRFDDVAGFAFTFNSLSAIDFFHPNATGQNTLADQTYPGSFTW